MSKPGITKGKFMAKLSQLSLYPRSKKKKINNVSGDNNNNSNERKHDVFLSFRGVDTCQDFIDHLHDALSGKNIKTYRDEELIRGSGGDGEGGGGGGGDGEGGGGGGGDCEGGGGGGGDADSDNDGGDNTEGSGGGGGGGEMGFGETGPRVEPDFRDFRNNAGDENGYPVGQLHRRNDKKPNVCSIISYEKNILLATAVMAVAVAAADAAVIVMVAAAMMAGNGNNDGGDKTEGGGSRKMGTQMKPMDDGEAKKILVMGGPNKTIY